MRAIVRKARLASKHLTTKILIFQNDRRRRSGTERPPQCWSFDVFDTTVTRIWFKPSDLFYRVGYDLNRLGLWSGTPRDWWQARQQAELDARAVAGRAEVTLDLIYDGLAVRCGWSDGQRRLARDLEWRAEMNAIRPIAATVDAIKALAAASHRYALISDTYFTDVELLELLSRCGVPFEEQNVFASSAHDATKGSGLLYRTVLGRLQLQASELVHAGDNPDSDLRSALREGIGSSLSTVEQPSRHERLLHETLRSRVSAASDELAQLAVSAIPGAARATRLGDVGATPHLAALQATTADVAAPLLTGFVLWVIGEAVKRDMAALHFLARDGQILCQIAQRLTEWLGLSIECNYLLASRKALFVPSLAAEPDPIPAILENARGKSLSEVLFQLNMHSVLDEPERNAIQAMGGRASRPMNDDDLSCFETLLRHHERFVVELAATRHLTLLRYLRQQGLASGRRFGIVDIGWHGNLQNSMRRAMSADSAFADAVGVMHGFYFGLRRYPAALEGRVSVFAQAGGAFNAALLETFCAADHGSVTAFEADGERIQSIMAEPRNLAALAWGLESQQKAILAFVDNLTDALPATPDALATLPPLMREAGLACLDALTKRPTRAEADVYGSLVHAVDDSHQLYEEIAPAFQRSDMLQVLVPQQFRHGTATLWIEGSMARGERSDLERRAWLALWSARSWRPGRKSRPD